MKHRIGGRVGSLRQFYFCRALEKNSADESWFKKDFGHSQNHFGDSQNNFGHPQNLS